MKIEEIKVKALPVLRRSGATRAGLFGSAAREEMRPDSDIDILVEIKRDISLLDFIGIQQELEDALGRKVDLVEYHTIKPALRENILQSEVPML